MRANDEQQKEHSSDENGRHSQPARPPSSSQSVDWYHAGESRTVEVDGIQVTVRLVGRKGRRSRIAIVAPAGAEFRNNELHH